MKTGSIYTVVNGGELKLYDMQLRQAQSITTDLPLLKGHYKAYVVLI